MTNTKLPKIVIIVGPTTSGKTMLGSKIAHRTNGEIINADAFQVYKDMQIGTNAPTKQEKELAKFHLNQFLDLEDKWDIKNFQNLAEEKIAQLLKQNVLPIVIGGSNLYVDALINNYDLSLKTRNSYYDDMTNQRLFEKLSEINREKAFEIGINDKKRLARALQLLEESKNINVMKLQNEKKYDCLMIECNFDTRTELYDSINKKISSMFYEGWVDEVQRIMRDYPKLDWSTNNAVKAIGYREIYEAINTKNEIDIPKIKQSVRNYAKRQLTWINNKFPKRLRYLQKNSDDIIYQILSWVKK